MLPIRWLNEDNFFPDDGRYMPVPDPDAEGMKIVEWSMEPGDAVAFNYRILHGARGNTSNRRRRAFSLRLVGDDARYIERPGRTSPPFDGHGMSPGERLREDWFPVIYSGQKLSSLSQRVGNTSFSHKCDPTTQRKDASVTGSTGDQKLTV